MQLFKDWERITSQGERLAPLTSFRLGGPARWLVRPETEEDLAAVLRRAADAGVRVRLLGRGANLLIGDEGVPDVVIHLSAPYWQRYTFTPNGLVAAAGANIARLVIESVRRGLAGLERMAGIPGSVGGCVRMNAGGRGGSLGEIVRKIRVMDRAGEINELMRDELEFGYRTCVLGDRIVLSAEFALQPDDPAVTRARCDELWQYKRATQPLHLHSAGCIFRNPAGHAAGALIDLAGLKGHAVGGAQVSPQHANFIVARDGARSQDVLDLIHEIQETVHDRYAVNLDLEVEVW
jgi:UDP-N-acetylmuramate dehydrogenase